MTQKGKESTWNECIETYSSLSITPDKAKANSLIDTAKGRIDYLKENTIKENNASYIFEGYYSSVLELLHVVLLLKGFKVGNHICLGYYLRDILKKDSLFRIFDDCRFKRNSLIYHGEKIEFETAKASIEKCIKLTNELNNIIKEILNY